MNNPNIVSDSKKNKNTKFDDSQLKELIRFADGEDILERYHAANVKKPSHGEAYFVLTNKRLLWYILSERTVRVNSINIEDIVSTSVYKTEHSFAIIINVRASTGAFTFYTHSHSLIKKGLNPEKIELEAQPGPQLDKMARELGALILNIRKRIKIEE